VAQHYTPTVGIPILQEGQEYQGYHPISQSVHFTKHFIQSATNYATRINIVHNILWRMTEWNIPPIGFSQGGPLSTRTSKIQRVNNLT
jgi:hypothetical protein